MTIVKKLLLCFLLALYAPAALAEKYPHSMGYVFNCGDFKSPVVEKIPTQTTVKIRCADGTVKHAILHFVIDGKSGDVFNFRIVEGMPVQTAHREPARFPVDAVIEHWDWTNTTKVWSKSAQELIDAGKFVEWVKGPIATTLIVADHTGAHDGLPQTQGARMFRPIFHVTYWHQLKTYDVRVIGENANTQGFGEYAYSLRLRYKGAEVYNRKEVVHWRNSRWTKRYYGGPRVRLKHSLEYLASTGAIPNYDPSITLSESAIAGYYKNWLANPREFLDRSSSSMLGLWVKASQGGGAQAGIGPLSTPAVFSLYSNDPRVQEMFEEGNDLFANYPYHFREGNPAAASYGEPLRITDRPTLALGQIHYDGTAPQDRVQPVGDEDTWRHQVDLAHQYDTHYLQYLLSGDYFALEEMRFLASYSAAHNNGAAQNAGNGNNGRGPTGKEGGLTGQSGGATIRGQSWAMRNRAELAFILPDGSTDKAYYTKLVHDALAIWEGNRNVRGNYELDPKTIQHPNLGLINLWQWGQQFKTTNLLNWWEDGHGAFVQPEVDTSGKVVLALSGWEPHFMMFALNRLRELGFERARPLWEHQRINVINRVKYTGGWVGANRVPTAGPAGFFTWEQIRGGFATDRDEMATYAGGLGNSEHGYSRIAIVAAAATRDPATWQWHQDNGAAAVDKAANPKWSGILPR